MIKIGKIQRKGVQVSAKVSLEIPEREPDDTEDITPNQLKYLKALAPDLEPPGGLGSLGKWQASAIIDAIKEAKAEMLAGEIGSDEHKRKSRSNGGWIGLFLIMVAVILTDQCSKS